MFPRYLNKMEIEKEIGILLNKSLNKTCHTANKLIHLIQIDSEFHLGKELLDQQVRIKSNNLAYSKLYRKEYVYVSAS